jgi:hypothetical protein
MTLLFEGFAGRALSSTETYFERNKEWSTRVSTAAVRAISPRIVKGRLRPAAKAAE